MEAQRGVENERLSPYEKARRWFISSYPLLGALAAGFEIVGDPLVCQRLGISVAAVDAEMEWSTLQMGSRRSTPSSACSEDVPDVQGGRGSPLPQDGQHTGEGK